MAGTSAATRRHSARQSISVVRGVVLHKTCFADPWRRVLPNTSSQTTQINPSRPQKEGAGISFRILEKGNQIEWNAISGCQHGESVDLPGHIPADPISVDLNRNRQRGQRRSFVAQCGCAATRERYEAYCDASRRIALCGTEMIGCNCVYESDFEHFALRKSYSVHCNTRVR
jgi:hypothetical protein